MIFLGASGSAHDEPCAHLEAGLGMVQHAAQAQGQGQRLQLLLKCALIRRGCKVKAITPIVLNYCFVSIELGSGAESFNVYPNPTLRECRSVKNLGLK